MSLLLAVQPRLYYVIGLDAGWTTPTAAAIVTGTGYAASGNELAPLVTTNPFDFAADATGLTAGTSYRIAFVWFDGTTYSLVEQSSPFTTSAGAGLTLALSGSAVTASAGSLLTDRGLAVSGSSVAAVAGTMTPGVSRALSGAAVTVSAGSVVPAFGIGVPGQAVTVSAGTLAPSVSLLLIGQAVAALTGTLSASGDKTIALTGSSVTTLLGALATGVSIAPGGSAVTVSGGTLGRSFTRSLSGAQVVVSPGTLTSSGGVVIVPLRTLPTWYYVPGPMPMTAEPWIRKEFERVSQSTFAAAPVLQLQPLAAEPEKPREGMIAYANGVNWNPGAGAGVYVRGSAAWTKL